jgi:hypothetical protein
MVDVEYLLGKEVKSDDVVGRIIAIELDHSGSIDPINSKLATITRRKCLDCTSVK